VCAICSTLNEKKDTNFSRRGSLSCLRNSHIAQKLYGIKLNEGKLCNCHYNEILKNRVTINQNEIQPESKNNSGLTIKDLLNQEPTEMPNKKSQRLKTKNEMNKKTENDYEAKIQRLENMFIHFQNETNQKLDILYKQSSKKRKK
jgi:hypothetical protein